MLVGCLDVRLVCRWSAEGVFLFGNRMEQHEAQTGDL